MKRWRPPHRQYGDKSFRDRGIESHPQRQNCDARAIECELQTHTGIAGRHVKLDVRSHDLLAFGKFPNVPTDTSMGSQFARIGGCTSNVQVTASGEESASGPRIAADFSRRVSRSTNLEENIDILVWFLIPSGRIVCELNS